MKFSNRPATHTREAGSYNTQVKTDPSFLRKSNYAKSQVFTSPVLVCAPVSLKCPVCCYFHEYRLFLNLIESFNF